MLIIGIACFAFIIITFSVYKITKMNVICNTLQNNNDILIDENSFLRNQNIEHLKTIERLNANINNMEVILNHNEKIKNETIENSKAALFELGTKLSNQLISEHRRETQEARVMAEKNIENANVKFNAEFERLVHMIGALNQEITQSKEVVGFIKQSLLSPISSGKLAEITLENILKSSGLRKQLDFMMQYNINTEDNIKLRPDAVIFLPAGNLMIIDAKASQFLVKEDSAKELSQTMNNHLKDLCNKDYAKAIHDSIKNTNDTQISNVITLMFLPTEQAIEKIINADPNFLDKAWNMNIFPVGPTGLMNMLSFAKFQIADQMRAQNHQLIIDEVKRLISSIELISQHSQKLASSIQGVVNNYDKFAGSFNRNLLLRTKSLNNLGIDSGNKNAVNLLSRYQLISNKIETSENELLDIIND